MTTIPIIMGLIPLALGIEEGGDMLQPMAVGAIGGLIMLLPVALFFMPCIYVISTHIPHLNRRMLVYFLG